LNAPVGRQSRGTPPKAAEAETAEERFFPLKSLLTLLAGILRGELAASANGAELQFDDGVRGATAQPLRRSCVDAALAKDPCDEDRSGDAEHQ
jgi:hypothetical protein